MSVCGGTLCYLDTDSLLAAPPRTDFYAREYASLYAWAEAVAELHEIGHPPPPRPSTPRMDAWFDRFEEKLGVGGSALGAWKREHPDWILSGQFIQPKSYLLLDHASEKSIVKLKGVGRRARTRENFERLCRGETVNDKRVEQHRTVLKEGRSAPREVIQKKSFRSEYDKRIVLADGGTRAIKVGG